MPVLVGLATVLVSVAIAACSSTPLQPEAKHFVPTSGTVNMLFQRSSFYDAPFPSDDLLKSDGTIAVDGFPNPSDIPLVTMTKAMAGTSHGFALEGAVYFTLTAPVGAAKLPTMAETVSASASVFVVNLQPASPDYLKRIPLKVQFEIDGGPYGAANLLSLLPLQGTPLRPKTQYAAVVTTALGLGASAEMTAIATGTKPAGLSGAAFNEYVAALVSLAKAGVATSSIAGIAVFTTDDPTSAQPRPRSCTPRSACATRADQASFQQHGHLRLLPACTSPRCRCPTTRPVEYPYNYECAATDPLCKLTGWRLGAFDAAGQPVLQRHHEEAGMVITIPRKRPCRPPGWPIAHFIRTWRRAAAEPLVDRGPEAFQRRSADRPGHGPCALVRDGGVRWRRDGRPAREPAQPDDERELKTS